jgi:hypothetical protein
LRANALIPILTELFDFPIDAGHRIDRSLAEAGLRAKGKGRNLPDMSRREALTFMIACMVAEKITKANEQVVPWLTARGTVNEAPSLEVNRQWNIPDEESEEYQHHLAVEALIKPHKNKFGEITFIDYLMAICALVEKKTLPADHLQLEIDFTDRSATVIFLDESGRISLTDKLYVIDPETDNPHESKLKRAGIKRKCTISGHALSEIISRT